MESMFRSIFTFVVAASDTFTMVMVMLNNLARSGVERTVVVEKKSIAAAAISELDNKNVVAERIQEIRENSSNISDEAFDEAASVLKDYTARRKAELAGVPIRVRRAAAKKPNKK